MLSVAHAQEDDAYEADPPDRAARLSYLDGDVSMQPVGEEDWAPAMLNRPLTTGDKLWTDRNSRAEIQVGPAAIRLDSDTGFSFLNVDDDTIQMRMTAGVISVSVRELPGNEHIEIDTPNIALNILRPGTYRVEVNDAGDTTVVKISEGEAEATGPGQLNVIVHAQETVSFIGEEDLTTRYARLGSPDRFDDWALERERRYERNEANSSRYVSRDVTGYEDLDEYGTWSSEPEYGYVWTPRRVAIGWSPYSFGRWVWVSPWGWTYVDDYAWGYAPFHYGRWAHVRNRWCWVPGPRHVRAVYAPALVGWRHGGGRVGWYPLGPREVYVPGRRFSHRWVERVNVSNTVIINRTVREVYDARGRTPNNRYRNVPGAVTVVSQNNFTSAGRTRDHRENFNERDFRQDLSDNLGPRIKPVQASRLGGTPRRDVSRPPQRVEDRQVIVKREPPAQNLRFARSSPKPDVREQTPVNRDQPVVRNRPDRPDRTLRTDDKPANQGPRDQPITRERVPDQPRNTDSPRVVEHPRMPDQPRNDRPSREEREQRDQRERNSEPRDSSQNASQARDWRNSRDYRDSREQPTPRPVEQRPVEQRPVQQRPVEQRPVEQRPVQREQPVRAEPPRQERQNSSPPPRVEQPRSEPKPSNQTFNHPRTGEGRPKANER